MLLELVENHLMYTVGVRHGSERMMCWESGLANESQQKVPVIDCLLLSRTGSNRKTFCRLSCLSTVRESWI